MNDQELQNHLKRLPVPKPSESARARALDRALVALRHAEAGSRPASPAPAWWRLLAFGGLAAGVLAVGLWSLAPQRLNPRAQTAWAETLRQMETLFPGQLNAVIERDGAIELDVAARPAPASEQPVLVEFSHGGEVLRVLSYSGRRVCVNLGGTPACFEALVTGEGNVILTGEDFLWDSRKPEPVAGHHVEARFFHPAS